MISELLPNMAELADEFCFIHSLTTQTSAHPQGENFMNTGFTMEGFPSFGAWVTYALGSTVMSYQHSLPSTIHVAWLVLGKIPLAVLFCRPPFRD